jgi:hypothetical protein
MQRTRGRRDERRVAGAGGARRGRRRIGVLAIIYYTSFTDF